jgi:hypothetical protein
MFSEDSWPWEGSFGRQDLENLLKEYDTFCVVSDLLYIYGVSYDNKYILYLPLEISNSFSIPRHMRAMRYRTEHNDLAAFTSVEFGKVLGFTGETPIIYGEVFYTDFSQPEPAFKLFYTDRKSTIYNQLIGASRFSRKIKSAITGKHITGEITAFGIDTKLIHGIEFNIT